MKPIAGLWAAAAVLTTSCGKTAPSEPEEGTVVAVPASTLEVTGRASKSLSMPPWKKEAPCYWVLTYPDGVAHRAWISRGQNGVFLNIVDDSMPSWPVSDALPVTLVSDGAPERSVAARGSHGDEDTKTLLSIILDEPQRALIADAEVIAITSDGRTGFELPMAGSPTLAALEACDVKPGPGEFEED